MYASLTRANFVTLRYVFMSLQLLLESYPNRGDVLYASVILARLDYTFVSLQLLQKSFPIETKHCRDPICLV